MVNVDESNASLSPRQIAETIEKPAMPDTTLPILSLREGEVPGTHTISWDSPVDNIEITHRAKSRDGFALGAVMAAEWIAGKKGIFSIDDMMSDIL